MFTAQRGVSLYTSLNGDKSCFFNSSLALALAAWDVPHTPNTTTLTHQVAPAAANPSSSTSNPFASMLGYAMPQHMLVISIGLAAFRLPIGLVAFRIGMTTMIKIL
ncbi:unnamed protein product [Ectocarpus sp. 12 AP-2014]